MLSRFFGERIGGVRFFDELERTLKDPLVNYPLLELQHACLALGFQGVHRTSSGGQATLQQIQRNVYETLRRVRPRGEYELSPHWQGQALQSRAFRFVIPIWAVAAICGVLLFALYVTLRTLLGFGTDGAVEAAAALHPDDKIEIARRAPVPPPPPPPPPQPKEITQRQRICAVLKPEIAAGSIVCDQTATRVFIRVGDLVLFPSGSATMLEAFRPVAVRIAQALEKEKGEIKVIGHTDSSPIRTVRFPSNWHLSLERAKAVAAVLKPSLSSPERIQIEGKGAEVPIATNKTPQGRGRNRRVEISIPRVD
jgi:type VI secretion system protein ImpK